MSEQLTTFRLTDLTRRELRDVATDLTSAVRSTNTDEMLQRRHLPGVIRRHQDESDSLRALFRAKSRILHDGAAISTVFDEKLGRHVGMGSLLRGLPLREPANALTGLLPAKLTRRSELLATQQFTDGPNITAWLHVHGIKIQRISPTYTRCSPKKAVMVHGQSSQCVAMWQLSKQ